MRVKFERSGGFANIPLTADLDSAEMEPDRAAELREAGMRFFCEINYLQAAQIPSQVQRAAAYFLVARRFEFAMSPFSRLYQHDLKPKLRHVKRNVLNRFSAA